MAERRVFLSPPLSLAALPVGSVAPLDDAEAHYARHVLRLPAGAPLVLLDGSGLGAPGLLQHEGKRGAQVEVTGAAAPQAPPARPLCLVIPAAKGERTDWLVEKATEMGVRQLWVTDFTRSVAAAGGDKRHARWERLARAACRQARHGALPTIAQPTSLAEAVAGIAQGPWAKAVAHPGPDPAPIADVLARTPGPIAVVIGPEGGLTEAELQLLKDNAYTPMSLGPYILRTETAAMVAAAACLLTPARGHHGLRH